MSDLLIREVPDDNPGCVGPAGNPFGVVPRRVHSPASRARRAHRSRHRRRF